MKKKGFTLIELLAVIVILAIIALIATPIVLNIINDTKKSAQLSSADFYLEAVDQAITKTMMTDANFNAKECMIKEDGNLLCSKLGFNECEVKGTEVVCGSDQANLTEVEVAVKGEKPSEGIIKLNSGKIEDVRLLLNNILLTMKDNILLFETDTDVIYEKNVTSGEVIDLTDVLEYDTIYNVTIKNSETFNTKAILAERNGVKYLVVNGCNAYPVNLSFQVDTYVKVEKTNERLSDYSILLSKDTISILSKHFIPGDITIIIEDENGNKLYEGVDDFGQGVSGYAETFHHIDSSFYNMLKENKILYIRIEQEINGSKVIRRYGGTTPKYQETHPYDWGDDTYYWGSNFYPGTMG